MTENTISTGSGTAEADMTARELPHSGETELNPAKEGGGEAMAESLPENAQEALDSAANPENPQGETVEINLYGERFDIPLEQAKQAAQKGLAFEHIKAQLEARKTDARIKTLEGIAQLQGTTVAQLLCSIQSQAVRDRLTQQYGSFESVPAQEISRAVADIEQTRIDIARSEAEIAKQGWKAQLREFAEQNPGVKEIPQEVIGMARAGTGLAQAYSSYSRSQLEQQLKAQSVELEMLKSSREAEKKATPSAVSSAERAGAAGGFASRMKSTW